MFGEMLICSLICCSEKAIDKQINPTICMEQIGKTGKKDWDLVISMQRPTIGKVGKFDKGVVDQVKKKQFSEFVSVRGQNATSNEQVVHLLNTQHIPFAKVAEKVTLNPSTKVIWNIAWAELDSDREIDSIRAQVDVRVFFGKKLTLHSLVMNENTGKIKAFSDPISDRITASFIIEVYSNGRYRAYGNWPGPGGRLGDYQVCEKKGPGVHAKGLIEWDPPARNLENTHWEWKVGLLPQN